MKLSTMLGSTLALLFALGPQGHAIAVSQPGAADGEHVRAAVTVASGANVTVIVPGSSIARADGVDSVMARNHSYPSEFLIWVAPNARKATVALHAHGVVLSSCTSKHLRPGTTSAVMCLVRSTKANGSNVSIDVVVRTSNFGSFSRTFTHTVTR